MCGGFPPLCVLSPREHTCQLFIVLFKYNMHQNAFLRRIFELIKNLATLFHKKLQGFHWTLQYHCYTLIIRYQHIYVRVFTKWYMYIHICTYDSIYLHTKSLNCDASFWNEPHTNWPLWRKWLHIYIYMYIIHIYVYIWYICIHLYLHMYVYTLVFLTKVTTHIHIYVYNTYMCICMIHMYISICTYVYVHTGLFDKRDFVI